MRSPLRIATVYKRDPFRRFAPAKMSTIRWLRISEGLAASGHRVDMIMNGSGIAHANPNLRSVPFAQVDWNSYDVIKTLFHSGFESLWEEGGGTHPFIISKLGSVVGKHDDTEGVYFFNREREQLYAIQERIHERSRYVTLLTEASRRLWVDLFGRTDNLLHVPTGVDREVPAARDNPYKRFRQPIALYAGNIYGETQPQMNIVWQDRLNRVGNLLRKKGIRLCFVGAGRTGRLDRAAVTVLREVDNREFWDFQRFANVGLVLAQGQAQHNESSKLYYYLRAGLPVVSESPVPNNFLIDATGMGYVADYDDDRMLVEMVESAVDREWPRREAIQYVVENHSWEQRIETYDEVLRARVMVETS
jgi:glycosyltransferase involved in cell wall biosynthesis